MIELDSTNGASLLESLAPRNPEAADDAGQADFLELLVAQLSNQDPLDPQDSGQFLTQLAQFEMVQGITDLNTSFSSFSQSMLSNQALQATSLVGRDVLVNSNIGSLHTGQNLSGYLDLPQTASAVNLKIYDGGGDLVRELRLGGKTAGEVGFNWDGLNDNGEALPPGNYRIEAEAMIDGNATAIPTSINVNVDSVTIDQQQGTILNLEGQIGSIPLAEVLRVS